MPCLRALVRLDPEFIVVVGGTGAVSAGVEAQLKTLTETDRISGADRYSTAALIAEIVNGGYEFEDPGVSPGVEKILSAALVAMSFPSCCRRAGCRMENEWRIACWKPCAVRLWKSRAAIWKS